MKKRLFLKATSSAALLAAGGCVQTVPRAPAGAGGAGGATSAFPPSGSPAAPAGGSRSAPEPSRKQLGGLPSPEDQEFSRSIFQVAAGQPGATKVMASLMELNQGQADLLAEWTRLRTPAAKHRAVLDRLANPVRELVRALVAQTTGVPGILPASGIPQVRDGQFTIPPCTVARFDLHGYCMDYGLPPPVQDDALYLAPAKDRVPEELWELYQAVVRWMAKPQNKSNAQVALWTLTGAGTSQYLSVYPYPVVLRAFDEAMPGGASVFQRYHERRMGPLRQQPSRPVGPAVPGDLNAINQLMDSLVRQGRLMADGRGVGHTLLAPGVAARGVGVDRLAGHYQIVNATNQPFVFHAAEYVAVPASRKQAVSGTTTVINPAYAEPGFNGRLNPASAFERIKEVAGEMLDFIKNPVFAGQLDWLKHPLRGELVVDRGVDRLRSLDERYPVKALASATPVVGNLLAMFEASTGRDWLYDRNLTNAERAIAALSILPGEGSLKLALSALDRAGALSKVASLAGVSGGAERVRRAMDSVVDSVYFQTLYGSLQPLLAAHRTDVERLRWDAARNGGDPSSLLSLSQDPANLLTWLADKAFRLETGMRDAFEAVASGRIRLSV